MMDPEMIRIAQEQMSRIPPDELLRMQQQMLRNPGLLRMATEGMKNIRPEDLRFAAEQMKQMPPEQIADMSARMANVTPEQIAGMSAQKQYEFNGALMLKDQGNQLHGEGKFPEAIQKYLKAKENLLGATTVEASKLRVTCSLNLMSCYLKTCEYEKVLKEGSEVLAVDPENLKALYRRGQAYKELRQLNLAVADLSEASSLAPDDETVAEVLQQAKDELERRGHSPLPNQNGPVIEEISEEEADRLAQATETQAQQTEADVIRKEEEEAADDNINTNNNLAREASTIPGMSPQQEKDQAYAEALKSMKQNPDVLRNMQTLMSNVEPEQIAAMSGGQMTPEMAKLAASMMKHMTSSDLERMVEMASGLNLNTAAIPPLTSDSSSTPPPSSNRALASSSSQQQQQQQATLKPTSVLSSDQVRQQMRDPAVKEMMSSMIKNMSPDAMASMSEQFGYKMTPEQAVQCQKAMANISPEQLDSVMKWAERAQMASEQLTRAKAWILGKPGLILAILTLLLAVVLHYLGFIG